MHAKLVFLNFEKFSFKVVRDKSVSALFFLATVKIKFSFQTTTSTKQKQASTPPTLKETEPDKTQRPD